MVVGGGIAGMGASLDLANQGFKVYMIEKKASIGGKMAQLDKTFPTNDCAMCTISPKLVEAGNHPNIEILTKSQVIDITGRAGNFKATIGQEPRYVDVEKCVACGDCVEECPVILPDIEFNEGLISRRSIYQLYPQATPNAFAITKRGIAPCRDACPSGQRAQGYIALIREGRWEDALRVIKMDNPFPGICGRICNHRCEDACNRDKVDEPINIRALKRFVTDKVYENEQKAIQPAEILFPDKRVAIIGAGPCGLTVAQDIIRAGYPVTIFEAMPVAGGMLRLGVPEYRLPTDIIEREVQEIIDLGVDLRLNHRVDDLDKIFEEGFESVLISVGAHEGIRLPIPGATLDGVIINTHFLRDVRLNRYQHKEDGSLDTPNDESFGPRVLVLGGGNVAIDCARSAIRLGCEVHLACLESRPEMPAHAWEVDAAEEEGVHLHPGLTFERILGTQDDKVRGVECMQVKSFHFDESGNLHLEKIPHSEHIIDCDTVIFSIGQRAGLAFIPDDAGVGLTENRTIAVNPNTFATSRPGVFAAGDSVSGTAFVIEAVANGHKAAHSITLYLQGQPLEPLPQPDLPVVDLSQQEISEGIAEGDITPQPRVPLPEVPVEERVDNFVEVEGVYDQGSAQAEAARCLACGICSECWSCVEACERDAINHDDHGGTKTLEIGAVVMAPGYQIYNAQLSEEYGLGRFPNVVTSLQYERMLSASGPTGGHVRRPSDEGSPQRIAFLQCVGSRDQSHDYCSSVCCMYAAKEAIMTIEHAKAEARDGHGDGEVHCQVFFMDTRAYSKGYQEYYARAEEKYGVEYTRCRISEVNQNPKNGNLILRYAENGHTLKSEEFDLVVLSVGMEISDSVKELSRQMGVQLDPYGFCHTTLFDPLQTSRPGIYVAGPFREPKDIPESVTEASGAAAKAAQLLAPARNTLTVKQEYPPEKDILSQEPRIGVFVCHCGSNIGGYLDVPNVAQYASQLTHVVHAEDNLYTCSQDTITHIIEQIQEQDLNRVIVASCTPITHEPLFQDALRQAGLNPYLFEMANIRNQCSWVHSNDWETATAKAKSLLTMAVGRSSYLEPLEITEVPVNNAALILGGGAAGMTAALNLAEQGFPVHLVERENELGGNLRNLQFFADGLMGGNGKKAPSPAQVASPQEFLSKITDEVKGHPLITTHMNTTLIKSDGFKGNFTSQLDQQGKLSKVEHGITIVATGGQEYKGKEYGYGDYPRIVTQMEFENLLAKQIESCLDDAEADTTLAECIPNKITMILCVGPAERYCSRICCTTALKNALKLKELNPDSEITILFRDIRTYGFKERLYTQARQAGVRFIHYEFEQKPQVEILPPTREQDSVIDVQVWEPTLGRDVTLNPDLLVLSTPVVPAQGTRELASRLKLSTDMNDFFLEAHVKLRPVDFSADGVYMAGMAHYPKFLDETIAQAQAAASRAALILSQETMTTNARVAHVDPEKCVGCLTCVRICPYDVPKISAEFNGVGGLGGAAYIEPAICHGCGSCASECPARAIQLLHYKDIQTIEKLSALFEAGPQKEHFVERESVMSIE
ncbi:MAG: NADPH-Fe(3+) oxidoreductase subunit beta [Chloroflexi bacterium]|nr:NADPH-Fe(3+) oxidoreductase subunit beta [Chloroflexota bacterium]